MKKLQKKKMHNSKSRNIVKNFRGKEEGNSTMSLLHSIITALSKQL